MTTGNSVGELRLQELFESAAFPATTESIDVLPLAASACDRDKAGHGRSMDYLYKINQPARAVYTRSHRRRFHICRNTVRFRRNLSRLSPQLPLSSGYYIHR